MLYNSLCQGRVWHKRRVPKVHQFSYKLNMWLIDIDDLAILNTKSVVVNYDKLALYRFKPQNYLRDDGSFPLGNKVRNKLTSLGAKLSGHEKIFLLGQLSNLGLYFSPLNLYFVISQNNCNYILAEVSNTPWNERHYYLLDKRQKQIINQKNFHVSPFFGLNQKYHWSFSLKKDNLYFRIDAYESEQKVFSAGYSGKLIATNEKKFKLLVIKSPLNVYKIICGIYFEALRLWFKKIPFVVHPNSKQ